MRQWSLGCRGKQRTGGRQPVGHILHYQDVSILGIGQLVFAGSDQSKSPRGQTLVVDRYFALGHQVTVLDYPVGELAAFALDRLPGVALAR